MGLYYQAFTGGAAGRGVAAEDILRRLRNVPVQAVIVGWSEDPALYRELGEAAPPDRSVDRRAFGRAGI